MLRRLRLPLPPAPPYPRRLVTLSTIPPLLLAPAVFTGLTLTLWSYKCLTLILFQSRIIYMPGIPLGARRETLESYAPYTRGLRWTPSTLRVSDGTVLATASTHRPGCSGKGWLIVYFQGNASSTPPRTPHLSSVLTALPKGVDVVMMLPSYRGYWFSTGRPSQRGITRDLSAIFAHLREHHRDSNIVLWGQSIGCGILMSGLASHPLPNVAGIVLETPFVGIREMLVAIYPQRWLPYRYLGWALWNRWEMLPAVRTVLGRGWRGKALVVEAGGDEVVPRGQAAEVAEELRRDGGDVVEERVEGALHAECLVKPRGREVVVRFLGELMKEGRG